MTHVPAMAVHERTAAYFSPDVVQRLQRARVSVVGAGGVGCEVCKNLAMLGIGRLQVCDPDRVSASNLNRGVFFRPGDVGRCYKVTAVRRGVRALGLGTEIVALRVAVERTPDTFWDTDVVCCCVDNDAARLAVNLQLLAADESTPCINGAVGRGLVAVSSLLPGRTACLACGWSKEHYEDTLQEQVAENCDEFFVSTRATFPQISPLTSMAGAWISYLAAAVWADADRHAGTTAWLDLERGRCFSGEMCRNPECVEPLCRV